MNQVPVVSDAAQLVLFAPYCGGVSREQDLPQPCRSLGVAHCRGGVRWPEEMDTPTNSAGMSASFSRHPEGDFDFAVTTHQLLAWLMDCSLLQQSEPDLPNWFWQWLLIERGDASEQA